MARIVEALFHLADEEDLAQRVRPRTLRRARLVEEEAEPAEDDESTENGREDRVDEHP